jgi:hypothetical protein
VFTGSFPELTDYSATCSISWPPKRFPPLRVMGQKNRQAVFIFIFIVVNKCTILS